MITSKSIESVPLTAERQEFFASQSFVNTAADDDLDLCEFDAAQERMRRALDKGRVGKTDQPDTIFA